ncbi:hypothetical protein ACROYT_G033253 [Oculina patagonica]
MATCWSQAPSDRPPFISLQKTMDTYIRQKTYLQVLDMDKYKSEKYSKVEDIGAEQTKELDDGQAFLSCDDRHRTEREVDEKDAEDE